MAQPLFQLDMESAAKFKESPTLLFLWRSSSCSSSETPTGICKIRIRHNFAQIKSQFHTMPQILRVLFKNQKWTILSKFQILPESSYFFSYHWEGIKNRNAIRSIIKQKHLKSKTFYQHFTVTRQNGLFSNVNEMRVVNASFCEKCLVFRNKSSNENRCNFAPLLVYSMQKHCIH